ncbi:hypothetical protein [Facilibium subflavum]|uniref:hypothetical protein n=1 Tax=Facilibium subflavum TaxID=2219058 RepID=UPI000E6590B8|nr:hypothetical protein [Facilibium subflavum]
MQQKRQKLLYWLIGVITCTTVVTFIMCFYLYSITSTNRLKIASLKQQMSLNNQLSDTLDFAYNFMSRLSSHSIYNDHEYQEKHLTTNVRELINNNKGWQQKILFYSISKITISEQQQSILKVTLKIINRKGNKETVVLYLYIEGQKGHFTITRIIAKDPKNPHLNQQS